MPTSRRAKSWLRPMCLGVGTVGVLLGVWLADLLPRAGVALAASAECPSKPPGDVNGDDRLTPGDALLAFKHFLLLAVPPLDECQQRRANVSNPTSSSITPADALCLFRAFLGLPSCLDNRPPMLTNPGAQSSAVGTSVSLPIVASDPDNTPLTFSATNLPPDLHINSTTGSITGTIAAMAAASSPYTVTLTVSDGTLSTSGEFTWTVPAPPVAEVLPHEDQFVSLNRETGKFLAIRLDGSSSKSPNGPGLAYHWTFTVEPSVGKAALSASDAAVTMFTPDDVGMYTLTLTVRDVQGGTASDTVVVNAQAPDNVAPITALVSGQRNDVVTLRSIVTAKGVPVPNWPVTYTQPSGPQSAQSASGHSVGAVFGGRMTAATPGTVQQDLAPGCTVPITVFPCTVFTNAEGVADARFPVGDTVVQIVTATAQDVLTPATFQIVRLDTPGALAVTATGALVVIDAAFGVIIRLDPNGSAFPLVSGGGQGTGPLALGSVCNKDSRGKIDDQIALALDEAHGSLVLVDCDHRRVIRVDLTTGDRAVVSGCIAPRKDEACTTIVGSGDLPENIRDLAFLPNGDLVVVDATLNAVLRVNLTTDVDKGGRSEVSGRSKGGGDVDFIDPIAVAIETDQKLVVLDTKLGAVLRVYLSATDGQAAGDRKVVSGGQGLNKGGTDGPSLQNMTDIAVLPSGTLLVLTSTAVVQVDPNNGKRTLLSGCQDGKCQGFGPPLTQAKSLAIEANGNVVVADIDQEKVFRINPTTGDRLVISKPNNPPTAIADNASTSQNKAITIAVLANDKDDKSSDLLRIVKCTDGTEGKVVIITDQSTGQTSVTYTPNVTFYGTDVFTCTVIDLDGGQATACVTVTVKPTSWGDFTWNNAPWSNGMSPRHLACPKS